MGSVRLTSVGGHRRGCLLEELLDDFVCGCGLIHAFSIPGMCWSRCSRPFTETYWEENGMHAVHAALRFAVPRLSSGSMKIFRQGQADMAKAITFLLPWAPPWRIAMPGGLLSTFRATAISCSPVAPFGPPPIIVFRCLPSSTTTVAITKRSCMFSACRAGATEDWIKAHGASEPQSRTRSLTMHL